MPTATITPLVFWVSVFTVLAMHDRLIPELRGHSLKLASGGAVYGWLSGNQFAELGPEPVRKNQSAASDRKECRDANAYRRVNQAHSSITSSP